MTTPSKETLDRLIREYKGQHVGTGYKDVIVSRENYKCFARALIESGFYIEYISWWEYRESLDEPNTYGFGGPHSQYYPGWFAETCTDLDEIHNSKDPLAAIIEIVENKSLGEYNGIHISFMKTKSLTPAFWFKVDKNWKSS